MRQVRDRRVPSEMNDGLLDMLESYFESDGKFKDAQPELSYQVSSFLGHSSRIL